jgi:rRNA-processing protein FCF1
MKLLLKVLVDSSLLMLCAERGRDYLSILEDKLGEKLEFLVPAIVWNELSHLASRPGKKGKTAKIALEIAKSMAVVNMGSGGSVDDRLEKLAKDLGIAVATVDAGLARRLRRQRIKILMVGRSGEPRILG